ncbi:hypothetical protein BJ165DRAFT_1480465 [Panaeolus papilionaceus]|nr:hypothetical protein BJ165DRAFT_1480465 [Panaeolus papilionaceus]
MHSFQIFVILAFMAFSSALPIGVTTNDVDATKVSNVAKILSENAIVARALVSGLSERSQAIKFDLSNIVINSDESINLAANSVGNILGRSPDHSSRGIGLENVIQVIGNGGAGGNINNVNAVKSDIVNTIVRHAKDSTGLSAASLGGGDVGIGLAGLNRRGNSIGSGDQGGQVSDESANVSVDAVGDSLFSGQNNALSSVTNIIGSAAKDLLIRDISVDADVDVDKDIQSKRH